MEIHLDCLPCFLKQVLDTTRLLTDDYQVQKAVMRETTGVLLDVDKYDYSPEVGRIMHNIVKKHTGNQDPYEKIKKENIQTALDIYPVLKHFLFKKEDRLYWALKIAATGNIIDSAINKDINIKKCLNRELEKKFKVSDLDIFKKKTESAKTLLIIGDNAGETVFDRVLMEDLLYLDITYAVRSEPIINDATKEDARASGIGRSAKIISTGCNSPGTILKECSSEFMNVYDNADIVISKGQGNYETLSEADREMFFLLKVKCPVISHDIGIDVDNYVFMYNKKG